MTTTLLVDLNMADGIYLDVYLEPTTYLEGSPASPPEPGELVYVVAEGGIHCEALVSSRNGLNAVLKLDMSTWWEAGQPRYQNAFDVASIQGRSPTSTGPSILAR